METKESQLHIGDTQSIEATAQHDNGYQQSMTFDAPPLPEEHDTQDLLRAFQEGEYPVPQDDGNNPYPDYPLDNQEFQVPDDLADQEEALEIPTTAAEKNIEIQDLVASLAGPQSEPNEHTEKIDQVIPELPDLEIKNTSPVVEDQLSPGAQTENQDTRSNLEFEESKVDNDKIPFDDKKDLPTDDEKLDEKKNQDNFEDSYIPQNNRQQQMVQTSLVGGLGHAFGSVINGVFSGIGMALGTGLAAVKQTKDAIGVDSGNSVSTNFEAGAHFHFSPAAKAANDSFNDQVASDWKNSRIDGELSSLQSDMDSHMRSIEKLKVTEWAHKLKAIEESGDPEQKAKAPAILNIAKGKIDFKDADKDMSFFMDQIQQRALRISAMLKESGEGPDRLEGMITKWQETSKKSIDELPPSKEGQGFIDRIQNAAQNILSALKSIFTKQSATASMSK